MELKGRLALISGVSSGIGKHTLESLLAKDVKVCGIGRTKPEIENENFLFITTDIRIHDEVKSAIEECKKHFNQDIDILINNAGLGYFANLEDMSLENFDQMFQTNVYGIFYTCRNIIPDMKKNQRGHIINISSVAGLDAYPGVSAYGASKWAVRGMSESLYKECRDDKVKVTCIYPGSVKTEFFNNHPGIQPHDYMLMPEDIADQIIYILESPENFHHINVEIRPLQPRGPKNKTI